MWAPEALGHWYIRLEILMSNIDKYIRWVTHAICWTQLISFIDGNLGPLCVIPETTQHFGNTSSKKRIENKRRQDIEQGIQRGIIRRLLWMLWIRTPSFTALCSPHAALCFMLLRFLSQYQIHFLIHFLQLVLPYSTLYSISVMKKDEGRWNKRYYDNLQHPATFHDFLAGPSSP